MIFYNDRLFLAYGRFFRALSSVLFATVLAVAISSVAWASTSEKNYLLAKKAFRKGDLATLEKHLDAIDASSPLQEMVSYWRADIVLSKRNDTDVAVDFVNRTESRYLKKRALLSLLEHYAKEENWVEYRRKAQMLEDMPLCVDLLLRIAEKEISEVEVASAWYGGNTSSEICHQAFSRAVEMNLLSENDVWRKFRLLAGQRKISMAWRVLSYIKNHGVSYKTLRRVARRASRHIASKHSLSTRANKELVAVSAMIATRSKPSFVATRWEKFSQYFDQEVNEDVWAAIAEWGSKYHLHKALEWYGKAGDPKRMSQFGRAWMARAGIRLSDWSVLKTAIEAMPPRQAELSAWRYWKGRALWETGDIDAAEVIWRDLSSDHDDFYGLLAREQLGLTLDRHLEAADIPLEVLEKTAQDFDIRLAMALFKSDSGSRPFSVWKFAVKNLEGINRLAAAELAARDRWMLASIHAADAATTVGTTADHWRFPMPYHDLLEERVQNFGLDLSFTYALVRQESRFMPDAISRASARGLMQVMPQTAKLVARKHKYTKYRLSRLTRPDTNILIGTRYLADLDERFDGELILMAAGYNAGPGRAKRWLRGKNIDKLVYIETIPILETRLYVKYLLGGSVHYDNILGKPDVSLVQKLQGNLGKGG